MSNLTIGKFMDGGEMKQVSQLLGATLSNGSGIATGAPNTLALGSNTITLAKAETVIIKVPSGSAGTVTTGTMTVTGSVVTLVPGINTITTTGAVGTITIVITVSATAEAIEIPGLRTVESVISVSLSGGYHAEPADCTIAGNKVTVAPYYYQDA